MSCGSPTVNSRIRASTNRVRTHMSYSDSSLSPVTSLTFCHDEKVIVCTLANANAFRSSRAANSFFTGSGDAFPGDRHQSTSHTPDIQRKTAEGVTLATAPYDCCECCGSDSSAW